MYSIQRQELIEEVKQMIIDASCNLDSFVVEAFKAFKKAETKELAKQIMAEIIENQEIARDKGIPMCQDTGIALFFVEIGNQIHLAYDLYEAINEGVLQGYRDGYLRKSIVEHPLDRKNTNNNTPAVIHVKLVVGDTLTIRFAPKGGGSENMSRLTMLTPADGEQGIVDFVKETVLLAGGKACPPLIIGVGIGGDFEYCAILAKQAIFRELHDEAAHPVDQQLEKRLFKEVNLLDVGPMGLGGHTTCLAVKVNSFPCHIASLPVAVNLQCHASRHKEVVLKGVYHG